MTTYNVALNFEDGVTRVIQCDDDEKVTDAAFRQKINLPMDCRDGVCGTCKCFVEKGEYELEFYMDESMSDEEAEQGYVLTCQMIPESDCVLRVPASSAICKTAPEDVEGEVLGVDRLSETSFGLRVKLAKPIGLPARPVCQRDGSRHGCAPLLLVLVGPRRGGGEFPHPQPARRRDERLSWRARPARRSPSR